MGITLLKLGTPSPLLPDEYVLQEWSRFRAISYTALPSYGIGFNVPLLWTSLLVTNRRVIVLTDLFHCMTQEIEMWYPGQNPADDPEMIASVRSETGLFGRCLEIRSQNPKRRQRWLFWSSSLTLRFFLRNPEDVAKLIIGTMNQDGAANKASQPIAGKPGSG